MLHAGFDVDLIRYIGQEMGWREIIPNVSNGSTVQPSDNTTYYFFKCMPANFRVTPTLQVGGGMAWHGMEACVQPSKEPTCG